MSFNIVPSFNVKLDVVFQTGTVYDTDFVNSSTPFLKSDKSFERPNNVNYIDYYQEDLSKKYCAFFYEFTLPTNALRIPQSVRVIRVIMIGGSGGGSGGDDYNGEYGSYGGGSGGSGGFLAFEFPTNNQRGFNLINQFLDIKIGQQGNGGARNQWGGDGGLTSFSVNDQATVNRLYYFPEIYIGGGGGGQRSNEDNYGGSGGVVNIAPLTNAPDPYNNGPYSYTVYAQRNGENGNSGGYGYSGGGGGAVYSAYVAGGYNTGTIYPSSFPRNEIAGAGGSIGGGGSNGQGGYCRVYFIY
jgi:hypothetical protein